ncbi:MAG: type IV secretory system conjugative DNA transfer family protein [Cyanobacteria bacterium P01_D01_bin.56]
MSDPRNAFQRVYYALSKDYRGNLNRKWVEQHGSPPPWTAAGQDYIANQELERNLLANPPQVHGNARWMSREQAASIAKSANADQKDQSDGTFILGGAVDVEVGEVHTIAKSKPPGHALTIAATRAGKGTSQIIPNIITYGGSMLVIDPKGENYLATHKYKRKLGRVIRIDPFRVTEKGDPEAAFSCFNPIASVHDESHARRLSELMMGDRPTEGDSFWYDMPLELLQAVIFYVSQTRFNRISDVRKILSVPDEYAKEGDELTQLQSNLYALASNTEYASIANKVKQFASLNHRLRSSILASLTAKISIWDEKQLSETVSGHHFDLEDMKHNRMTVYVILPFDRMNTYRAFLRIIVGQFYQAMIREDTIPEVPVACIVDEFPALGQMTEIVKGLAEIGGYGVRFWLFAQGLAQLEQTYPKHYEQILSQCSTVSIFGVTDGTTAKWLSEELGNETTAFYQSTTGAGGGGLGKAGHPAVNVNTGRSVQLAGKPLLSTNDVREVLGVGSDFQVILLSGHPPMLGCLIPWYTIDNLKERVEDTRQIKANQNRQLPLPPKAKNKEWGFIPNEDS